VQHVLELVGVVLGTLASLVVVCGAVPAGRCYRWLANEHRRRAATEDLIAMHNWPDAPPPCHRLVLTTKGHRSNGNHPHNA
jgi:hypothetical protein